jgi:predicted AAA+ superfamily ATPase
LPTQIAGEIPLKLRLEHIATTKFYFFDIGVSNYLTNHLNLKKGSAEYGTAFEQLIYCELSAFRSYNFQNHIELYFWRTQSQLEVDFILVIDKKIFAIEVKSTTQPRAKEFNALQAFKDEFPEAKLLMITSTSQSYVHKDIEVLSVPNFVDWLWTSKK